MIKRKGTIVSFGNASGPVAPVNLFKLTEKNVKLLRPSWVADVLLVLLVDSRTSMLCGLGSSTTW